MNYTFELNEEEANFIIIALQELPAKIANPLTKKLQDQAREQQQNKETPAAE